MEIKVQITVKSEVGQPEVVREVARLERGSLRSETLGLSLAEARAILGGLEKTMAERQKRDIDHKKGTNRPPAKRNSFRTWLSSLFCHLLHRISSVRHYDYNGKKTPDDRLQS